MLKRFPSKNSEFEGHASNNPGPCPKFGQIDPNDDLGSLIEIPHS